MTKTESKKILEKLNKIESMLIQIIPLIPKKKVRKRELTEEDVLKIVEEGNREYREGRTKVLTTLKDLR